MEELGSFFPALCSLPYIHFLWVGLKLFYVHYVVHVHFKSELGCYNCAYVNVVVCQSLQYISMHNDAFLSQNV